MVTFIGSSVASAGQYTGPYPTLDPDKRVWRVGSSSQAAGTGIRYQFVNRGPATTLRAIMWRNGAEHAAGTWSLQLAEGLGPGQLITSASQSMTPHAWNTWTFATGVPLPHDAAMSLDLTPVNGADLEFINTGTLYGPAQRGNVTPADDVRPQGAHLLGGWGYTEATLVFILDGVDPFAPATCVGADRSRVSGWPYDDFDDVVVAAGATTSQTAIWISPTSNPFKSALGTFSFWLKDVTASEVWADFSGPSLPAVSLRLFDNVPTFPSGGLKWSAVFGPAFAPGSNTFTVTLRPVGGSLTVRRWTTTLPVGGPCDPIARATWGGSGAHAGSRIDADLMFGYVDCATAVYYRDADGDGFGDARAGSEHCWEWVGVPPGYVANDGDCDDANANRHPNAVEICNGLDDDCDGFTDAQDVGLSVVPCELDEGVCSGALHSASTCVAGTWRSCTSASYGASYEATELTCDGLDNDCDGTVDEVTAGPLCVNQLGVCAGSRSRVCSQAQWVACSQAELPATWQLKETSCDGADNDCDGQSDDQDTDLIRASCEQQLGVCAGSQHSRSQCRASGWESCGPTQYGSAYEELESRCDALDNDCDGIVDEGCAGRPAACGPDAICEFRSASCGMTAAGPCLLLAVLAIRRRPPRRPRA